MTPSVRRRPSGDDYRRAFAAEREVHWRPRGTAVRDFLVAAPAVALTVTERLGRGVQAPRLAGYGHIVADDVDRHVVEPCLSGTTEQEAEREADRGAWYVEHDLLPGPIRGEHHRPVLHVVGRLHDAVAVDAHEEDSGPLVHADRLEIPGEPHSFAAIGIGANALREHRRAPRRFDVGFDRGAGEAVAAVAPRAVGANGVFAGAVGDGLPAGRDLRARGNRREYHRRAEGERAAGDCETSNVQHTRNSSECHARLDAARTPMVSDMSVRV